MQFLLDKLIHLIFRVAFKFPFLLAAFIALLTFVCVCFLDCFLQKFAFSSCAKGKHTKNADTDEASGGLIG